MTLTVHIYNYTNENCNVMFRVPRRMLKVRSENRGADPARVKPRKKFCVHLNGRERRAAKSNLPPPPEKHAPRLFITTSCDIAKTAKVFLSHHGS